MTDDDEIDVMLEGVPITPELGEREERRRQINLIIDLLDTAERTINNAKLELLMLKRELG